MHFDHKIVSITIFISSYILFILLSEKRTLIAVASAILLILFQAISLKDAFWAINWNVMGIFLGTLAVADIFMESRVPAYLAETIVNRSKNTAISILLICALTGVISAFVENVATVLIVAPIALSLANKLKINPMSTIIAIAVSSNLQGTATLIGDPPSMLLGGYAKMNFFDFFVYKGRPSIFFAVEIGALAAFIVLFFIFKDRKEKVYIVPEEKVRSWVPSVLLICLIILLAISSFLDSGFSWAAGIICMVIGAISISWDKLVNKGTVTGKLRSIDWDSTFFLAAIFVLVGCLTSNGWIDIISSELARVVGGNLFLCFISIVAISVLISAFVDNVPYLAAMLPVAISLSKDLNTEPSLLLFGLLIGASLGGNITPIGASANIVACGLLKKEGYPVTFPDFMRVGIPFTFAAVPAASLFIWLVWT